MRRALACLVLLAGSARAAPAQLVTGDASGGALIARDPPPPPPPPPPPIVAEPPPPDDLGDRLTLLPGFGMIWLDGGSGVLVQPTVTRTFDRFELQGELGLASWHADTPSPHHGLFGRLAATARYQAARLRVDRTLALDLVVEAGAGIERRASDDAGPATRPDAAFGLGLRMLGCDRVEADRRVLVGLEVMARVLVSPAGDGVAIVLGLPIGR